MAIADEFDPRTDGWFFENWGETGDFSWELYRRTYLGVHPTNDPVAAPLDSAFYEIFKSCAAQGNCGGMALLGLAVFKYGGFYGFGSPANFYAGAGAGPDRADLHEAINLFQARQFSTPGIRNFLDVVKAGQLNDGVAAWHRVRDGLSSGDYHILSLASGLVGDAAHTVIPYRATQSGGTLSLWVWDPNRPYDAFPAYYDSGFNRIDIDAADPKSWSYDQNAGGTFSGGHQYAGSQNGWFFAIPTSMVLHKAHQPSLTFAITGVTYLLVSGTGAAVTQVRDDGGRTLFTSEGVHAERGDLETTPGRRLEGVAPWPFTGGLAGGGRPGELYVVDRPAGAAGLDVSVQGRDYRLHVLSADRLVEVTPTSASTAPDRVRIEDDATVEVRTDAARRRFDVRHVRRHGPAAWRAVTVKNALVTDDALRVRDTGANPDVEISGNHARRDVTVEFERFASRRHSRSAARQVRLAPDGSTVAAPGAWESVPRRRRKG